MRPVTVTTSDASGGTVVSNPVPMDHYESPFNVGLGAVVTGTATYTVQHTFDDPFSATFVASSATWFDHASLAAKTTSSDGNYAFPVRAIRLEQTAGTGSVSLVIVQAGMPGK